MSSEDMQSGEEEGTPTRNEPWNTILQEIRNSERRTKDWLKRLVADVQRGQEEALEKAMKQEKPYILKKKSHQVQYDFNEQVMVCIYNAKDELKRQNSGQV